MKNHKFIRKYFAITIIFYNQIGANGYLAKSQNGSCCYILNILIGNDYCQKRKLPILYPKVYIPQFIVGCFVRTPKSPIIEAIIPVVLRLFYTISHFATPNLNIPPSHTMSFGTLLSTPQQCATAPRNLDLTYWASCIKPGFHTCVSRTHNGARCLKMYGHQ